MRGYFDYNATTPTRAEVAEAMTAVMAEPLGNPSSMHKHGRAARAHLDTARDQLAALLDVAPSRIVFTSGATESNNIALRGHCATHPGARLITTDIEHVSILATCRDLAASGRTVDVLPVDRNASPAFDRIAELTAEPGAVVATAWANGESGHIADVAALADAAGEGTQFLWDAAQAVGRIPVCVGDSGHMLSLSAHKFGGPRGIGALIVSDDQSARIATGGGQERGLRPGTENLPGIVGMGVAADIRRREMAEEGARLAALRDGLWSKLESAPADVKRITPADGLPNTLTLAFAGTAADVLLAALDLDGYSVSSGSACAAGAPEPSHVMMGLGLEEAYLKGVVRISMGPGTTEDDVHGLGASLEKALRRATEAA